MQQHLNIWFEIISKFIEISFDSQPLPKWPVSSSKSLFFPSRVRHASFEALLAIHSRGGLALDVSTLYPQFCLALVDDYEGVRSIALSLIHVLATANPEEAVKIKVLSSEASWTTTKPNTFVMKKQDKLDIPRFSQDHEKQTKNPRLSCYFI